MNQDYFPKVDFQFNIDSEGNVTWTPAEIGFNHAWLVPGAKVTAEDFTALMCNQAAQSNGLLDVLKSFFTNFSNVLTTRENAINTAHEEMVKQSVSDIVGAAPEQLDTLAELAAALNNNADFATTLINQLATKVSKAGDTMTGKLRIEANSGELLQLSRHNQRAYMGFMHTAANEHFPQFRSADFGGAGLLIKPDGLYEITSAGAEARVYSANNPPPTSGGGGTRWYRHEIMIGSSSDGVQCSIFVVCPFETAKSSIHGYAEYLGSLVGQSFYGSYDGLYVGDGYILGVNLYGSDPVLYYTDGSDTSMQCVWVTVFSITVVGEVQYE